MWSFGCILAELHTGRPLFPALDENELLEFFVLLIGKPPIHMIHQAKKRHKFFHLDDRLIPSQKSRLVNADQSEFSLREALGNTEDREFLDFL